MKNDVAFLFDCEMHLYEHQSTLNLNMPLRGFMYMAKLWQNWIKKNNKNIYKKKLVKLPTPQYAVFYNGSEDAEDVSELHLYNPSFCERHQCIMKQLHWLSLSILVSF